MLQSGRRDSVPEREPAPPQPPPTPPSRHAPRQGGAAKSTPPPTVARARRAAPPHAPAAPRVREAEAVVEPPAGKPAAREEAEAQPAALPSFAALRRPPPPSTIGWRIGAALTAAALAVQMVNHSRDELVSSERFGRLLTSVYGKLGVHLEPRWDLHAYEVRQLGASAEQAGASIITVRASIKNDAPRPQPLPLLRVTLQDRFGNRIASRDVAPRSYLPPAVPVASLMARGQRVDAEMGFVDPGANAVGFEIDACLPQSGGVIACANDAATR